MKFTDGFWLARQGVDTLFAKQAYDVFASDRSLTITAPTKIILERGDTLNRAALSITLTSPLPDVIGVRIEHHAGALPLVGFDLPGAEADHGTVSETATSHALTSGGLSAVIDHGAPWSLQFMAGDHLLTSSDDNSIGYHTIDARVAVDASIPRHRSYLHEKLSLGVGELVYGFGERFGPLVKNGQTIDTWNADGGTSSDQAYKNIPFYLTNRGYGIFVNNPGHVSFEVGSEAVERVQFSAGGESLEYFVIYGATPKDILTRYTQLTGRPVVVPAWSYGMWLSTSFTTDYDEETIVSFIDGMAERDLPLSVFHFDCFWMREFNWSDFEWDGRVFPDPDGMIARLHDRGLRVSLWINPYIAQRSPLFREASDRGFLLRRPDGSVWQWDLWQAGMGLVDFSNPDATAWYQSKLRRLLGQGVDAFKTDFAERIPLDVTYFDGSDPERMHNLYTKLYNRAVFDVIQEVKGEGEALVFARSATVGSQSMPVHWGGDSTSSYESMAETLRGGLSLAFGGFGFWSHDIGGFEGTPDAGVFKRWAAFGLLSSHSRLHGSDSYRVPWIFDEEAVEVTRAFTKLKMRLMPYLYAAGLEAADRGIPVMRPMQLEFADDPAVAYLDRQYMIGADLLVAPVFRADGTVEFYLPAGLWTNYFTGEVVTGGCWRSENHGFDTLPLYVRDGAVIPVGSRDDRPDYDYLDGLILDVYSASVSESTVIVTVTTPDGDRAVFTVTRTEGVPRVSSDGAFTCSVRERR